VHLGIKYRAAQYARQPIMSIKTELYQYVEVHVWAYVKMSLRGSFVGQPVTIDKQE
jgi:hypothetical protein